MAPRPTKRWWKTARVYRHFAGGEGERYGMDFSEDAASEAFVFESTGQGRGERIFGASGVAANGYMYGKKMLDLTLAEWRDGCWRGLSLRDELRADFRDDSELLEWFDALPRDLFARSPDTEAFLSEFHRSLWKEGDRMTLLDGL